MYCQKALMRESYLTRELPRLGTFDGRIRPKMSIESPLDIEFGETDEPPAKHQGWSAERLVQLGSGLVTLILAVVQIVRGGPGYLVWIVAAFALFLIALGIYAPLRSRYLTWKSRREDARIARQNWPKFRGFVRRFGEFINPNAGNNLEKIIQQYVPHPLNLELQRLTIETRIWSAFWGFFHERVEHSPNTMSELSAAVLEFNNLLGCYGNFGIYPVFDGLNPQLKGQLTPESKARLNTFRERYTHFLTDYMSFGKELSDSRPELAHLHSPMQYPNQL